MKDFFTITTAVNNVCKIKIKGVLKIRYLETLVIMTHSQAKEKDLEGESSSLSEVTWDFFILSHITSYNFSLTL